MPLWVGSSEGLGRSSCSQTFMPGSCPTALLHNCVPGNAVVVLFNLKPVATVRLQSSRLDMRQFCGTRASKATLDSPGFFRVFPPALRSEDPSDTDELIRLLPSVKHTSPFDTATSPTPGLPRPSLNECCEGTEFAQRAFALAADQDGGSLRPNV